MAGQSKTTIEETKINIVQKLESWKDDIILAILIIDLSLFRELYERWSARGEIPVDVEFYSFLSEIALNVVVIANKIDKVKKRVLQGEIDFLQSKLKEATPTIDPIMVFTSAQKRQGLTDLVSVIDGLLIEGGLDIPRWAVT
jgi:GTP-binding protein EngB required for normal cell division